MGDLKLGYFEDFKGSDSVLMATSSEGVRSLIQRLRLFAISGDNELPLHQLAWVAPGHEVELYAVRSPRPSGVSSRGRFDLLCSSSALEDISAKLSSLATRAPGHQYFTLLDSEAQLIVSVGEYDGSFWSTDG
jgi:hypothetical protein